MIKTSFSASSFSFCSSSSAASLSASWLSNSSFSLNSELSNSWIRAYNNVRKILQPAAKVKLYSVSRHLYHIILFANVKGILQTSDCFRGLHPDHYLLGGSDFSSSSLPYLFFCWASISFLLHVKDSPTASDKLWYRPSGVYTGYIQ